MNLLLPIGCAVFMVLLILGAMRWVVLFPQKTSQVHLSGLP